MTAPALEQILRRDQLIIGGGLLVLTGGAWWYTMAMAASMENMEAAMLMPMNHLWSPGEAIMVFVMWTVMMAAMMTPSVTPLLLTFAQVHRKRRERQRPYVPTGVFLAGYFLSWASFSLVATGLQWALQANALLSPQMRAASPILGGLLLTMAGLYQLSSWKYRCLVHCRDPLGFIMTAWREGWSGALRMGIHHGVYCLGCCWLLMTLLFVVGVMNLLWVALIAIFVLLEKILETRKWISSLAAAILVVWGAAVLINA